MLSSLYTIFLFDYLQSFWYTSDIFTASIHNRGFENKKISDFRELNNTKKIRKINTALLFVFELISFFMCFF